MNACCVIGIGCDDHGDQIAGLLVARAVRRLASEHITAIESSGAPAELIAAWSGVDRVVVVEAMPGGAPGTVSRCQPHPLEGAFGCSSTRLSPRLREALALGPLPHEVTAVTIAAQSFVQNSAVTPAVAAAAEEVAGMIVGASRTPWPSADPAIASHVPDRPHAGGSARNPDDPLGSTPGADAA